MLRTYAFAIGIALMAIVPASLSSVSKWALKWVPLRMGNCKVDTIGFRPV